MWYIICVISWLNGMCFVIITYMLDSYWKWSKRISHESIQPLRRFSTDHATKLLWMVTCRYESVLYHTLKRLLLPCHRFDIFLIFSIELFLQNFFDKKNKTLDNWMFGRLGLSFCAEIGYGSSANRISTFGFDFCQCESITKGFISKKVSRSVKRLRLVSKFMLCYCEKSQFREKICSVI